MTENKYKLEDIIFGDLILSSIIGLFAIGFTYYVFPLMDSLIYFGIFMLVTGSIIISLLILEYYFHIRRWRYVKTKKEKKSKQNVKR